MAYWIGKREVKTMNYDRDFEEELRDTEMCEFCEFLFKKDDIYETMDGEKICQECITDHGFVECDQCGAVFEKDMIMTCPSCGHQVRGEEEDG